MTRALLLAQLPLPLALLRPVRGTPFTPTGSPPRRQLHTSAGAPPGPHLHRIQQRGVSPLGACRSTTRARCGRARGALHHQIHPLCSPRHCALCCTSRPAPPTALATCSLSANTAVPAARKHMAFHNMKG